MATSSVCSCFCNVRPRYKRLVDMVFPPDSSHGLVKSNMEKLIFYALSAPEKLDRIGDYMFLKMSNFLYRKRIDFVYIAMEAMDNLLLACRSSSLNLFVESFLKMVSMLLESNIVGLQICASSSFVKFANIEEDTPSYHRRYEFFISRFSQLCYGSNENKTTERSVRLSGLYGLQGVVRKTVNDDLQANIWDAAHMSKIVPALLYNIELDTEGLLRESTTDVASQSSTNTGQKEDPAQLADLCLRELVTRAGFNNIAAILSPLLTFMDDRSLWLKNEFPLHIFRLVMFSIQNQYSYRAIEILLSHLDKHKGSQPEMKASIVKMLSASVKIATSGSIGPSILEVFNTLLKHLKISIDIMSTSKPPDNKEKLLQKAIITAAGAFSSILADYQRVDVMLFIILKVPSLNKTRNHSEAERDIGITSENGSEEMLQLSLLKCLLKVAESHQTKHFTSTFSSKFLDALLAGLLLNNADVRVYYQMVLVSLLDRKKNSSHLEKLCSSNESGLTWHIDKCSRQDASFIHKNNQDFCFHIYESCCLANNTNTNFKLLTFIVCLLTLEFGDEEIVEFVSFVLGLQNLMLSSKTQLSSAQKCCVHGLVTVFFMLICDMTAIPALQHHTQIVIAKRSEQAPCITPSVVFSNKEFRSETLNTLDDSFFFDRETIVNALKNSKYETKSIESPFVLKPAARSLSSASLPENFPIVKTDSLLSVSSSIHGNDIPVQKITYEDLKDALREKLEMPKDAEEYEKIQLHDISMTKGNNRQEIESKLMKTIDVATLNSQRYDHSEIQKNLFEIEFPSIFIY
uniref:Protein EFR3 homolog B n=1 Tax=Hydra vulgaris TaxID=6087 RepID=T2M3A5_HYDVU